MSSLSEKELLLLSNYEYFTCSTYSGTIKENIKKLKREDGSYDIDKVVAQGATGDIISEEDAIDILSRLEEDEKLSGLYVRRNINRGGIRATLYADESDNNATLVFRGTGGTYKAWEDNVLGEYQTDTKLQSLAADFVRYECGDYDNITVTGHSKGGNLSQYVTVVCGNQIDKCVSFDGQGFGRNFIDSHSEEVNAAKDKITCINGFNDFVNILLTPIAGTILYVKNQEGISVDMHSCYTMLSNGSFDSNGDFKRDFGTIPQLPAMTMAKWASDGIVAVMDSLPKDGDEKASKVLAAWVASIFSNDKGEEFEKEQIEKTINDFKRYSKELIGLGNNEEINLRCSSDFLLLYTERVKKCITELDSIMAKIVVYPEIVEDVLVRLDYSILGRSFTENALKKIIMRLDKNINMLSKLKETLGNIVRCYEETDCII